ncbi:MAG: hypothetical protein A4E52_01931 [Pelotomaculum sp. PtaB.Bin013]|nr:MAG: hypothetical protein A4E52_01931 [Pelotomaculum sp. PtaB.Bin013]
MLGGGGGDLVRHPAEALLDQSPEGPSSAVPGEHGQVVDVEIRGPVRLGYLLGVDVLEPIVCGDGARVVQDQSAQGVVDVGVFLDPPVRLGQIPVHGGVDVQHEGLGIPEHLVAGPVEDVGLGHLHFLGLHQDRLHDVLDLLDGGDGIAVPAGKEEAEPFLHGGGQPLHRVPFRHSGYGAEGLSYGRLDLGAVVLLDLSRAFYDEFDERTFVLPVRGAQEAPPFGKDILVRHSPLPGPETGRPMPG